MTYAIFKAAGFQYRAELGELLRLPSLDAEPGGTVTFDEVLLGAGDGEVLIGRPTLEGAAVRGEVVRHGRGDKVVVYKFKRRKNYRRKTGHRQDFTEVRINEIDLGGKLKVTLEPEKKEKKEKKKPAEKKAKAKKPKAKKATAKKATTKKASSTKKTTKAKSSTKSTGKAKTSKSKSTSKSKKKKS